MKPLTIIRLSVPLVIAAPFTWNAAQRRYRCSRAVPLAAPRARSPHNTGPRELNLDDAKQAIATALTTTASPSRVTVTSASPAAHAAYTQAGFTLPAINAMLTTADSFPGHNGRLCFRTAAHFLVVDPADGVLVAFAPKKDTYKKKANQHRPAPRTSGTRRQPTRPLRHRAKPVTLPLPTARKDFIDLLEDRGFIITPGRKHTKVIHPAHPGKLNTIPSTASDYRWIANAVRDIRHNFGIDLRRATGEDAWAPMTTSGLR
ncbi:hypothetical protein HMPREF2559_09160 [Corynebacterium sp. HMSC072G08]|uniref:hypothetical protein n=1 Tax=Corynebacterium TaxID=1716 RepID=UPI000839C6DE|nr:MULTISPECIES: hypothetical protein [Corynebacterium]OFL79208.1 hypothetical protein HMPREF2748_10745 [Corynebacterium sp. HMSC077B05]OFN44194.1 hypothetical protein HMPREF2559_09160 [Corynebacterium sp. HMSC072G08]